MLAERPINQQKDKEEDGDDDDDSEFLPESGEGSDVEDDLSNLSPAVRALMRRYASFLTKDLPGIRHLRMRTESK